MENTNILMEPDMKDYGNMIYNMEKEQKLGMMGANMKEITLREKNKEMGINFFERKYHWTDGSVYDGEWHDNKINGYGIYSWTDGRRFEG